MADNSKIEWCDATFNPWRGCTKVSAGCDHCYAETASKRNPKVLGIWGDDGTRVVASDAYWREPLRWNREAEKAGVKKRVFCASLADIAEDRPELIAPRARLAALIDATPWLIWMLLTKRPENLSKLFSPATLSKCGVGTTTEDQRAYDSRIGHLLRTPARYHFISAEPLLGPIDLRLGGMAMPDYSPRNPLPQLGQVIVGGESGGGARDCAVAWVRSIVRQCQRARVPVFVKQLGARVIDRNDAGFDGCTPTSWPEAIEQREAVEDHICGYREDYQGAPVRVHLKHKKGGAGEEWPADLRIREFATA